MQEEYRTYVEEHFVGQEIIWGRGYMSPGGEEEVAAVIYGVEIEGKRVLDIGSGLGGPAVALAARHGADQVVGVDIQENIIEWARAVAKEGWVDDKTDFQKIKPGPLPFDDESFDVVFSLGAFVHIPDKNQLMAEVFRVLRPGGAFAANDWVREWDSPVSEAMARHAELLEMTFHWATPREMEEAINRAGFPVVTVTDHQKWLRDHLNADFERMKTPEVWDRLSESFGEGAGGWLANFERLAALTNSGELGAIHIRATK
jgi:phosphoethanolamine N-methyltransferase